MKLATNWREVLRHAWSIRLIIMAGLLSGAEAALPYMGALPIAPGVFAVLSLLVTGGAFVARLVAQPSVSEGGDAERTADE